MKNLEKFSEQFSIVDLDKNAISDLTAGYLWDREHGHGNNTIKLEAVRITKDRLYIHYRTYPTYSPDNMRVLYNGSTVPTKYYDTIFEFDGVTKNLGDAETWKGLNPPEKIEVLRDFIETGMCRTWCNCGAFYYTGAWEDMAGHGSTIFPFPGPKGKGIGRAKHAAGLKDPLVRICKHIAADIHYLQDRDIPKLVKYIKL